MRVTSNAFPDTLVRQLARLNERQNRLQNQAATGQRIQTLAEDPAAARRTLGIQSESRAVGQYRKNIATLQENVTITFGVMKGLKKISDRANEIAVLADGTRSPAELQILAGEVTQLIRQGVQLANSQHRGDYVFGGNRTDRAPFVLEADANGVATGVTYRGDSSASEVEIASGETMSVQHVGANSSGSGPQGLISDPRSGADFFNHLISLHKNLMAGKTDEIRAVDLRGLQRDEDNFISHFARQAALQSRLEATDTMARLRSDTLEKQVSQEVDADLAETIVRLTETQNAYRAALQSAGTILNQSLMDFIR